MTIENLKIIMNYDEISMNFVRKIDLNDVLLSEIISENIDEDGETGSINRTIIMTLKNHHDTINLSHENNTYTYSDILELEWVSNTSGSISYNGQTIDFNEYDKATIYYAKGIGAVAYIDFNCLDEDGYVQDNVECVAPDYLKEFYNIQ